MARQKDAKDKYQSKIKSKRYRRALRKRKQEQEKSANVDDDGEADQKAEFDRVKERADLRHKTISKKLRFYDNTNSKESLVVSFILELLEKRDRGLSPRLDRQFFRETYFEKNIWPCFQFISVSGIIVILLFSEKKSKFRKSTTQDKTNCR